METGLAEEQVLIIMSGFFFVSALQARASSLPSRNATVSPALTEKPLSWMVGGRSFLFFIAVPVNIVLCESSVSVSGMLV